MKQTLICLIFLLTPPLSGFSGDLKGHWVLEKSEISYTVTHPLHVVHGKSLSTRGKGVCYGGHCEFHLGVLVKSFDSGDENRDLHMFEVTKAGLYPLIDVKAEMPDVSGKRNPPQVLVDATVTFAGKTVKYPKIKLDASDWKPNGVHLKGLLPLKLKDFSIQAPSLLTMPVQDDVPVALDLYWKKVDSKESNQK
ncbi:MAG TPA: hypothetical protein VMV05_12370 [bacterium]|nr:hypothetical protein [bacterium]